MPELNVGRATKFWCTPMVDGASQLHIYMAEFNRRFSGAGGATGQRAYASPQSLDLISALQFARTVNRDNTISIQNFRLD
jgi:hypothetical protein